MAGLFTVTPYAGGRLTFYNQEVVGQAISNGPNTLEQPRSIERTDGTPTGSGSRWRAACSSRRGPRASTRLDGTGGIAALQHVIEPRANFIEIRGINQKANPQWEPGGGPTTRVDPGYEARTGIDAVNKANEVTYSADEPSQRADHRPGPNEQPVALGAGAA